MSNRTAMKIKKRSIVIAGRETAVSVEDEFWESLREIAKGRGESMSKVIAAIDADRGLANLSSAIRLFVLHHYRNQLDQWEMELLSRSRR